jgi:hypothetical protein
VIPYLLRFLEINWSVIRVLAALLLVILARWYNKCVRLADYIFCEGHLKEAKAQEVELRRLEKQHDLDVEEEEEERQREGGLTPLAITAIAEVEEPEDYDSDDDEGHKQHIHREFDPYGVLTPSHKRGQWAMGSAGVVGAGGMLRGDGVQVVAPHVSVSPWRISTGHYNGARGWVKARHRLGYGSVQAVAVGSMRLLLCMALQPIAYWWALAYYSCLPCFFSDGYTPAAPGAVPGSSSHPDPGGGGPLEGGIHSTTSINSPLGGGIHSTTSINSPLGGGLTARQEEEQYLGKHLLTTQQLDFGLVVAIRETFFLLLILSVVVRAVVGAIIHISGCSGRGSGWGRPAILLVDLHALDSDLDADGEILTHHRRRKLVHKCMYLFCPEKLVVVQLLGPALAPPVLSILLPMDVCAVVALLIEVPPWAEYHPLPAAIATGYAITSVGFFVALWVLNLPMD